MKLNEVPFNISILKVTPEFTRPLGEVKSLEIFESGTNNLKADGLFSTEIFGPLGSDERDLRFGYMNLHTQIFHGLYFKRLVALKQLYLDICSGKRYAIWDPKEKDFLPSDELEGNTGYAFFVKHFMELEPAKTTSTARDVRIQLIKENKDKALTSQLLVMPAGLRDINVAKGSSRTTEDEINTFYRSILSTASTISSTEVTKNDPIIDTARMSMQRQFVGITDYVMSEVSKGKNSFVLAKWASRKVRNGTMNVISPIQTSVDVLGTKRTPGINDIQLGMSQMMVGMPEVVIHYLRSSWLGKVFGSGVREVTLVDPKTLKPKQVNLSAEEVERWTTIDGLKSQIQRFVKREYRQRPIRVEGHYLGLLYHGKEGFKIFNDIDTLPEGFDRNAVTPLNLTSLFYLSGYKNWNDYIGILTRYPVAGDGSTIVGGLYLKTTTISQEKQELGEDWTPIGGDHIAYQFPDQSTQATFIETLSPHLTRLKGLGGDYDGDKCTLTILYGDLSIKQFREAKYTVEWYVNPDGSFKLTGSQDNINLVFANITGGPNG